MSRKTYSAPPFAEVYLVHLVYLKAPFLPGTLFAVFFMYLKIFAQKRKNRGNKVHQVHQVHQNRGCYDC